MLNHRKLAELETSPYVCDNTVVFFVHIPDALQVSAVGSFNGWKKDAHPLRRIHDGWWISDPVQVPAPARHLYRTAGFQQIAIRPDYYPALSGREDALFLGPPGTGKSHLAQAIGRAAILQGYRVVYREAHTLLEELAEATLAGTRKDYVAELSAVPLLISDDLGMRKLATRPPKISWS